MYELYYCKVSFKYNQQIVQSNKHSYIGPHKLFSFLNIFRIALFVTWFICLQIRLDFTEVLGSLLMHWLFCWIRIPNENVKKIKYVMIINIHNVYLANSSLQMYLFRLGFG